MQTFLPYADFARSAEVLDGRRLGKQRVEVLQILRALHLPEYGWSRHPAVLMWRGRTDALVAYGLAVVDEWCARGGADTTRTNIQEFCRPSGRRRRDAARAVPMPPWLGCAELHRSHRSALVRKDPLVYGPLFPDADPALDYVWPEPPEAEPAPAPFSAWAVRAGSAEVLEAFSVRGVVGIPTALGSSASTPKQRRQHTVFTDAVAAGDTVVTFLADLLRVGVVTGEVARRSIKGERYWVRGVSWRGERPRSELIRPYQLQDPRTLFALSGETDLR